MTTRKNDDWWNEHFDKLLWLLLDLCIGIVVCFFVFVAITYIIGVLGSYGSP